METSFKLDRWMLKFLWEFANPVEDRPEERDSEWVFGDIVITPSSDFGVNTMATMLWTDQLFSFYLTRAEIGGENIGIHISRPLITIQ
ncbi:hypothetical protein AC578_6580 [Pseudocercospora eumusae]|uniref:Uncharacterized protein n=1 Tax=Pseudocercospora eumusae TaxID=321146 RepID=A0A139HHY4_9PEZI|nr:hypothetical protein AC578_6580 [Pseudocercospora eumusae]